MAFGDRIRNMFNPNIGKQSFGSSALQQAMGQQRTGNVTPQAQQLLDQYSGGAEMQRQSQLMDEGRHGDYGVDRQANPYQMSAPQQMPQTQMPPSSVNPPIDYNRDNGGGVNISNALNEPSTVNSVLSLDRLMKTDPSKLNAEGIKLLQTNLNQAGYKDADGNELSVDGKMGKLTASAMSKYTTNSPAAGQNESEPLGLLGNLQNTIGNPNNDPESSYSNISNFLDVEDFR